MFGCKKSQNVTCNVAQSFQIAYNGDTQPPQVNAMPGDSINFQADVLIPGKYVNYEYQPNALAGCAVFWDFGDGSTSTALSPNHVYDSSQTYTVHLILNHDSANIISSSIYIGPLPIYTQLIAGTRQWQRTRVVTNGPTAVSTTTISDTTFTVNMVNEKTISIASEYLQYMPMYSTVDSYRYFGLSGGDPMYRLTFNHTTNKIQYVIVYGWWMTDTFDNI